MSNRGEVLVAILNVDEGRLVPRRINLDAPGGVYQLGLFDDSSGDG
jgi:hypothetical protein